ncbi:MAG: D-TA family PLP-dependent enzyme [Planctomycetaceae bacterium]
MTSMLADNKLPDLRAGLLADVVTPSVIVLADRVRYNVDRMIDVAGSADRLRPHCKTHKMSAVVKILLEKGITRHKAATIAEVEMLADAGATDIVFAYNPVGPNIARVVEIAKRFPDVTFAVTADHEQPLRQLASAAAAAGVSVGVLLDVDPGLHRTGLDPRSNDALNLYRLISELAGVRPAGFHVYDGHQHQHTLDERRAAVMKEWPEVISLKRRCEDAGLAVPELLCGGTPTFPVYAELDEPAIALSPGTAIFHDAGYGQFDDLPFEPAALVATRVISRSAPNRVTVDLGNKSVAADPPKGARVVFPDLPDAKQVIHNEEHLVLETDRAKNFQPGDLLLGIPMHICPTIALHPDVTVIENGEITGRWEVTARNHRLTI